VIKTDVKKIKKTLRVLKETALTHIMAVKWSYHCVSIQTLSFTACHTSRRVFENMQFHRKFTDKWWQILYV